MKSFAFDRIRTLTLQDWLQGKSVWAIYASLLEEIGELANALKVEEKIVQHKILKESAACEAVDVAICGAMIYALINGPKEQIYALDPLGSTTPEALCNLDPFVMLADLGRTAGELVDAIRVSNDSYTAMLALEILEKAAQIFVNRKGKKFNSIVNQKLTKWEKNNLEHKPWKDWPKRPPNNPSDPTRIPTGDWPILSLGKTVDRADKLLERVTKNSHEPRTPWRCPGFFNCQHQNLFGCPDVTTRPNSVLDGIEVGEAICPKCGRLGWWYCDSMENETRLCEFKNNDDQCDFCKKPRDRQGVKLESILWPTPGGFVPKCLHEDITCSPAGEAICSKCGPVHWWYCDKNETINNTHLCTFIKEEDQCDHCQKPKMERNGITLGTILWPSTDTAKNTCANCLKNEDCSTEPEPGDINCSRWEAIPVKKCENCQWFVPITGQPTGYCLKPQTPVNILSINEPGCTLWQLKTSPIPLTETPKEAMSEKTCETCRWHLNEKCHLEYPDFEGSCCEGWQPIGKPGISPELVDRIIKSRAHLRPDHPSVVPGHDH